MANKEFDIAVIGGGPGGYVAAIRAAQLGMRTALIEAQHLGGICLNWGCIPTKVLLRSAEIFENIKHAEAFGLEVEGVKFDVSKIVDRSRKIAAQLSGGVAHLLKKNGVEVFDGWGKLGPRTGDKRRLLVEKDGNPIDEINAKYTIIASGARARDLPGMEPNGETIWSYKEAMVPKAMPASVLVVGSGAIGIEFASFYRTLGAEVTVVEILDRILPVEDAEISALAQKAFQKQGMKFHTGAKVEELRNTASRVEAQIVEGGSVQKIAVDAVIVAVGIVGNVEGMGLEDSAVEIDRGHIVIDEWMRTGEAGVYAIGDVAGPPWLAHKASHEGVICVEKIAGNDHVSPLNTSNIPGCTYCHPQIASVGLTEENAVAAGHEVRVGRFPFIGNGKAIALGTTEGMIKTIFDKSTGELLGAHMIGAEVTELIQGYCVAKSLETTEADLMETIFPHPTLSEMMHESVLSAYDRAIHI